MVASTAFVPTQSSRALLAIMVGGLISGALDLTSAFITFGWDVPRVIAAGLLGRDAIHSDGAGVWLLGVFLHFFITCVAGAVYYYAATRRLPFLIEHPLVCGLFFGIAIFLVMSFIVLPLSALHSVGPYKLRDLIQGLLVHMVLVGLPISFSVRLFFIGKSGLWPFFGLRLRYRQQKA